MIKFLIALQFLTIIPVKIKKRVKEGDFGKSLLCFPLVGALIGFLSGLTLFIFGFLPYPVTGILALIVLIVITGGVHLDGFADTVDGFYAGRTREEILAIMRDSRTGSMGVIGITCLLLLKFTLMVNIPRDVLWKSLILMAALARWSQALACYTSKYARENGKAKLFIEYAGRKEVVTGGLFTLALFLLLAGLKGLALFFLALAPVFLFAHYAKRKLGGMTGDTIGAVGEIAEAGTLFFALICF